MELVRLLTSFSGTFMAKFSWVDCDYRGEYGGSWRGREREKAVVVGGSRRKLEQNTTPTRLHRRSMSKMGKIIMEA